MNCPNCNTQTVTNAHYCHNCGDKISQASTCPICQTSNTATASNCSKCGVNLEFARASNTYQLPPLPEQTPTPSPKTKTKPITSILGFIFTCVLALLAYGFIKDIFVMPIVNDAQPPAAATSRPTDSTACIPWTQITTQHTGLTQCVYGTVKAHLVNPATDKSYFYFGQKNQFYIIGTGQWQEKIQSQCIQATGLIKTNNEIPYMQVTKLYQCK